MFDITIQTAEAVTIATPPAGRRYQPPNITFTNQHFSSGFSHGFIAALTDTLNKDRTLSDDDIVANIKAIFDDETPPTEEEIIYACGQLVGELLAKV